LDLGTGRHPVGTGRRPGTRHGRRHVGSHQETPGDSFCPAPLDLRHVASLDVRHDPVRRVHARYLVVPELRSSVGRAFPWQQRFTIL